MVIACSDSRVDPSQMFDFDPGEVFVVRNVAALVPPFETTPGHHGVSAALEFAVQILGVKEIVVLGHGMCGGCKVALTRELHGAEPGEGGFIADWIGLLDEARGPVAERLGTAGREAERAMEHAGVRVSLANLRSFPCVPQKERGGTNSDCAARGSPSRAGSCTCSTKLAVSSCPLNSEKGGGFPPPSKSQFDSSMGQPPLLAR